MSYTVTHTSHRPEEFHERADAVARVKEIELELIADGFVVTRRSWEPHTIRANRCGNCPVIVRLVNDNHVGYKGKS